jgi:hypothetical protein
VPKKSKIEYGNINFFMAGKMVAVGFYFFLKVIYLISHLSKIAKN